LLKKERVTLSGVVECDEVYLVAGHTLWGASKGQPEKVAEAGRKPRCRRLKGAPGRGTLATEKPPVFGMIQRTGEVVIRLLDNVQQATIKPLIQQTIMPGTHIYTDEYTIYGRLEAWGYPHKTVNHSAGEYARDEGRSLPQHYFPGDDPAAAPCNTWRGHGHLLFGNWINETYQTTPFDRQDIGS